MASSPRAWVKVCGTELLDSDSREIYRQKIARITLDSMVQFVGLLDAEGTVLEINQVALDAVGITLKDVEGQSFWNTFWWQVSDEINGGLRESIRRAAQGEFVRWDTEIYGRAGGKETIVIDASLMPVKDECGKVVFIAAEGRDITAKKAYEREIAQQREELAELDKLKTRFFANISHEFRTPLTLMMGPLEDAIADKGNLSVSNSERLELAHRNSLRLLKLVNSLLDFSRIESGRIQACYEPTDLAKLTAQLASVFRSAMERAGLQLIIDCRPLSAMVYVDREMWEKIVLNLLSNAFKFTFEGEVSVELGEVGGDAELLVRDSGTGIPAAEIPRLFERFHRVTGARGRSYEGSGIGLALVQELVRLHGGTIIVESEVDKGTTFRIRLPFGKSHLPAEQIGTAHELASTAIRSEAFVQEALRWQAEDHFASTPASLESAFHSAAAKNAEPGNTTPSGPGGKVLVVDDNSDMREYVQSLLADQFTVLTAANGEDGLKIAQMEKPNLILTDIMMPGMDGFALLRALRSEDATRATPVIFLSARAGEEATIEGRVAGADDYLVKPFSARELLARVSAHLKLAQARKDADARIRENEARFRALVTATSNVIYRMSPDWREMAQLQGKDFLADTADASNLWMKTNIHPDDQAKVMRAIQEAIQTKHVFELEHRVFRADGTLGWTHSRAVPMMDDQGNIVEWFGASSDITATKQAQASLRQSLAIVDSAEDAIISKDLNGVVKTWNQGAVRLFGYTSEEMVGQPIRRLIPEELLDEEDEILRKLRAGGRIDHYDTVRTKKGGERIEVSITISPIRDASGGVIGASKIARDISDRKRIERLLIQSEKLAATGRMAAAVAHEINNPLESLINLIFLARKDSPPEGKAHAHLQTAEHELERVAHIARQTLGYYRDTGLPTELHLYELIENVLTVYKAKLLANEIKVEVSFNDKQKISVSQGELLQVFSNIITNAIDAMHGGGTLSITTNKIAGSTGEGVQTVIEDSGVGIEQENLERIFEPFFTTKGNLGTGIGLWIARQLAERRGGQISIASSTKRGRSGTCVTIFIPFAAPTAKSSTLN